MPIGKLPHIVLTVPPEVNAYTTPNGGGNSVAPLREREPHGQFLQKQLRVAWESAEEEQAVSFCTRNGIYLEFASDPDFELNLKSLENITNRIRLLNVRKKSKPVAAFSDEDKNQKVIYATVYVPHNKKKFFLDKLKEYVNEETPKGKPKNAKLVDSIADIQKALGVDSFWVDSADLVPIDDPEWVEVWLSSDTDDVICSFENLLADLSIQDRDGHIKFPERTVKVIYANRAQLEKLIQLSDYIAEYRLAKATAAYWTELSNKEQAEWVKDLLKRCHVDHESKSVVCLLDTGVNNGHPLIQLVLSNNDCQAVNPEWGTDDHHKHGHGTLMAGIAAYGDLTKALESSEKIELAHRLESVKILPPNGSNEPDLWGYITSQAISRAEIQAPNNKRTICIAITAEDTRDRGRPSSWSAELDKIASGADDDSRRLLVVSAGNTFSNMGDIYPDIQKENSVHDPAQAWNALTVGAFTELDQITDDTYADYTPVAPKGGLSPFSTTSATWEENKWPIKPELVLEGGNLAIDDSGLLTDCDDLSLLSTFSDPQKAHFSYFNMTSAATARLAWMAGKLQASNPGFWPETIRALLIHSAEWPEVLKNQFLVDENKKNYKNLMSICGYGVPNLEQAMYSAQNSLTLIAESTLQPFDKKSGGGYKTKDMHLYELPWPKEVLLNLPDDTSVKMRITLSYFVEPGPGEVGWKDRYRYASHALRFELNSPGESKKEFSKRVNKAMRNSDEGKSNSKSPSTHWLFGTQARDRGSIHSDIWKGTAAELADSNFIAVLPMIGWWRERGHLKCWNKETRYALIVSITASDEMVDVYTPVAIQVGIPVPLEVKIST